MEATGVGGKIETLQPEIDGGSIGGRYFIKPSAFPSSVQTPSDTPIINIEPIGKTN